MSNDVTELMRRLRSGHHNADLITLGGCTHDGRCLSAADEIGRLRETLRTIVARADDAKALCKAGHPVSAYNLASGILGQIGSDAVTLRKERT